jgi:hypothetical protein
MLGVQIVSAFVYVYGRRDVAAATATERTVTRECRRSRSQPWATRADPARQSEPCPRQPASHPAAADHRSCCAGACPTLARSRLASFFSTEALP